MKSNGKDKDGFENVDGKAPEARRGKPTKVIGRAKDGHLPGMEPKTIPSVHRAIEEYVVARDNRMQLTTIEVQKKAALMEAMKKAGVKSYNVSGHVADLDMEETIKARLVEPEEGEAWGTFTPAPKKETKRRRGASAEARA